MVQESVVIYDLYSGPGGVGYALDHIRETYWSECNITHVGVDVEDYSTSYPGEFIRADASQPPLNASPDLLWMSPPCLAYSKASYWNHDNPREHYPTFDDLNVRDVIDELDPVECVVENVATCEDLREPCRIDAPYFGLDYTAERHFETSFCCPDARTTADVSVSAGMNQAHESYVSSSRERGRRLARKKGVPESWDTSAIRSAIALEYVQYIMHYCPSVPDVPLPDACSERQSLLSEVA